MVGRVMEGTWEEISRCSAELAGQRVRLIVLTPERIGEATAGGDDGPAGAMISRGMFPQLRGLTDADLAAAEFRGDADDGLDWS